MHQLDIVIDGVPIQTLTGREGATILSGFWLRGGRSPLDVFRGRAVDDLAGPGRVPLLVCQECADPECGVLTAALQVDAGEVTWSDFRWVTGYDDDIVLDELPSAMRFDRKSDERELDHAEISLAALPREVRRPPRRWWSWR
ncbi:hypothetical protein [Klenkia soli]|uniref:hypothetical protein n=1 Tax=Klenkia soli TaxID=1052260 RepID=UPI001041D465|nr:hypothetical protein [Klenkia soli]